MNNKFIFSIFLFIAVLGMTSCDRDNLYDDPSNPGNASSATMLTSLEVNTFMNVEGELTRFGNIYSQHFAGCGGQFVDAQNYDLTENEFDNMWGGLYANTMYNAKLLISQYGEGKPYFRGISKVLLALNLGIVTDLWGDVPYSDAFNGMEGNFFAKYDSQEQILKTIQTLLDEGISELSKPEDDNLELPGDADLIFGGNPNSWIRSAWILKARYANRLSLKDASGSANLVEQYINNALAITNASSVNMEAPHSSSVPNQWGAFQNARSGYIVANKYYMDILKAANDPRLKYFFSKDKSGEYVGAEIQQNIVNTAASTMNYLDNYGFFNVSRSYPIITEYEAYFLLAEAQNRLGKNASAALNNAIKASISYVTNNDFDGEDQAVFTDPTLTEILTQKWIAFCGQMEPYNDFRRTGIPALKSRAQEFGAVRGYTPERMPTPQNERTGNPTNAKPYELDVKVWWAQK